jgi:hypothetical protein
LAILNQIERHREGYRQLEIGVLSGLTLVLSILFVWGVYRALTGDLSKCADLTANSSAGPMLAGVTIVGFIGGRAAAYVRKQIHQAPAVVKSPEIRTGGLLQMGLALFLTGIACVIAYETYALLMNGNPPPITSYVRCAAADHAFLPEWLAGLPADVAAFLAGLLIGNWLWYPSGDWLWHRKKTDAL